MATVSTPPTLQDFENAAQAAYDPSQAPSLGLAPLLDAGGQPVAESLSSGMVASAFIDRSGNVIIAYQGTSSDPQYQLDTRILSGDDAAGLPGFSDAVGFASRVQSVARDENIAQNRIFVTGHSLGGTLASFVAQRTGLDGVGFAASGIPGFHAAGPAAAGFVSLVERGDPFANYATDTAEHGSAAAADPAFDHYGTVVQLGSDADAAALNRLASEINGYSLPEYQAGRVPASPQAVAAAETEADTLMAEHHPLAAYEADAASMSLAVSGRQSFDASPISFIAAGNRAAEPASAAAILRAASAPFAADFPDLANAAVPVARPSIPTDDAAGGGLVRPDLATVHAGTPAMALDTIAHRSAWVVPMHDAI